MPQYRHLNKTSGLIGHVIQIHLSNTQTLKKSSRNIAVLKIVSCVSQKQPTKLIDVRFDGKKLIINIIVTVFLLAWMTNDFWENFGLQAPNPDVNMLADLL